MEEGSRDKSAALDLPAGTVTFLFTDIEGSTKLLHQMRDRYADLLTEHHRLLREIFAKHNGREVDTQGDAFFVAFPRATDAMHAVISAQKALVKHTWPGGVSVKVRMGLHTGEPQQVVEGYVGMDVHRAARIATIGHGGQVLLSITTAELVRGDLPDSVELKGLGSFALKDMRLPEPISQLLIAGLKQDFPPLKAEQIAPPPLLDLATPPKLPAFLLGDAPTDFEPPLFVARERELAWLTEHMRETYDGNGRLVFITGEAGAGKSALVQAFIRHAQAQYPDLLVAQGQCNVYAGTGDSYLPFRQVMDMLTGDVESRYLAGAISPDHARRLWEALPETAAAIVDHGPYILPAFLPGTGALKRLEAAAPAETKLVAEFKRTLEQSDIANVEQGQLLEQYGRVLKDLAARGPLLLVLDDMQWTDTGSANLLFHLGRDLQGHPILLLAAYRPEEVEVGRKNQRHPLEKPLSELKRLYGDVWLRLNRLENVERRAFVDALIDSEPNRLGSSFRQALFHHTEGHALFTIELLQDLQERDELVWDEGLGWVENPTLDWQALPPKVEGIIEERINRLETELKELLTIASVEGGDFTAQVIARILEVNERQVVRQLTQELDRKHRLVGEQGIDQLGSQRLFRYRFRHSLFQQHIYNGLSGIERQLLHEDVGTVLEALYGEEAMSIAPQLAWHFSEAGDGEKAVPYLLTAGDRARYLYNHGEAIAFFEQALTFLKHSDNRELSARTQMKLGLSYQSSFDFKQAQKAYEKALSMWQQAKSDPVSAVEQYGYQQLRLLTAFTTDELVLEPPRAKEPGSREMIRALFAGLLEQAGNFEIIPDMAETWEVLDEGRRYIFHLRKDALWSDGEPVTAQDFVIAWKRVLHPSNKAATVRMLFDIKGAEDYHRGDTTIPDDLGIHAHDTYTLLVELEQPCGYFLQIMGDPVSFPVPSHKLAELGESWSRPENIVCNGPFVIESWQEDEHIHLVRNPNYRGRFPGNVGSVHYHVTRRSIEAVIALYESDALDLCGADDLFSKKYYFARRKYADEIMTRSRLATGYLAFNVERPPFDDVRVRRAFAYTINRDALLGDFRSLPATGGLVPPGMPGHVPGINYAYDPEQARRLLTEVGFPDGRDFPDVYYVNTPVRDKTFQKTLEEQFQSVLGVHVEGEGSTWNDFFDAIRSRRIHIISTAWGVDYPDPDSILRVAYPWDTGWHNDRYLALIQKARRILEQGTRMELYREAETIIHEEVPIVPLIYLQGSILKKPWVSFYGSERGIKNFVVRPH